MPQENQHNREKKIVKKLCKTCLQMKRMFCSPDEVNASQACAKCAAEFRWSQRAFTRPHLKQYGITAIEYDRLLELQGGVCAICELPNMARQNGKLKALSVDHNHETGEVRGLLCGHCNVALGMMREDIGTAMQMMKYIAKYCSDRNRAIALEILDRIEK